MGKIQTFKNIFSWKPFLFLTKTSYQNFLDLSTEFQKIFCGKPLW